MSYHLSLLLSGILQVWFLVASFVTWYTIEKFGRRLSFMITAAGMTCVMVVLAAMVAIDTHASGIVAAAMIFLYQAFYTWGFMGGKLDLQSVRAEMGLNHDTGIWVYGPEVMPLKHRAKGEGLATACLWLSSFVVIEIVPVAISNIGWRTYLIFACFNLAFIPFAFLFLPETAGLSLETIDLCFIDRSTSPVKKANELRKQMKQGRDITLDQAFEGEKRLEVVSHVEHAA